MKLDSHAFQVAREFGGKLIDNREKYDVTCVKMTKNASRYLAFPTLHFFKSLYSSRQSIHLSNSIFSNVFIEQMFLNVKIYNFLALKKHLLHIIF